MNNSGFAWKSAVATLGGLAVVSALFVPTHREAATARVEAEYARPATDYEKYQAKLAEKAAAEKAAAGAWEYFSGDNKLTGKPWRAASVTSPYNLQLPWPYQGANQVKLLILENGKTLNIRVEATRGQVICEYANCRMTVRFDDEPAKEWSAAEAADHSRNMLFFNSEKAFLAKLRKAKKLVVGVMFYESGVHQVEFDVSKLKF